MTNRSTSALVAEYRYNGLNHRIGWHSDVTDGAGGGPDGTVDSDDPRYFFVYDDQWRVIATYRKEDGQAIDSAPKEWFVYHAAGLDGYGGSSYIDATVLRDRDFNTAWHAASDGTLEQRRYYCQNWRADVVAVLSEAGVQDERVAYSAYGVPFGMPAGDTDADGDFDTNDQGAIAFWEMMSTYDVRGDVNLDGSVTSADSAAATTESLGWEVLSGIDSRKGYAGYEQAPELAGTTYHVRYRVLKADLGRWLTRDPEGYVDGMSLYAYVQGMAAVAVDPMGLLSCHEKRGLGMAITCGKPNSAPVRTIPPPPAQWPPRYPSGVNPSQCAGGTCGPAAPPAQAPDPGLNPFICMAGGCNPTVHPVYLPSCFAAAGPWDWIKDKSKKVIRAVKKAAPFIPFVRTLDCLFGSPPFGSQPGDYGQYRTTQAECDTAISTLDEVPAAACRARIRAAVNRNVANYTKWSIPYSAGEIVVGGAVILIPGIGWGWGAALAADGVLNAVCTAGRVLDMHSAATTAMQNYCKCPPATPINR